MNNMKIEIQYIRQRCYRLWGPKKLSTYPDFEKLNFSQALEEEKSNTW